MDPRESDTELVFTMAEAAEEVKKGAWEAWLAAESCWTAFPKEAEIRERFEIWWKKRGENIWGELERLSAGEVAA